MIDWFSVFINSFWILGLSLLLAALSYHYWLAREEERRLREQYNQPSFLRIFWISLALVGVGLAGTSQYTWETAVWILFIILSIVNAVQVDRQSKT